jgi:hypothetical protein
MLAKRLSEQIGLKVVVHSPYTSIARLTLFYEWPAQAQSRSRWLARLGSSERMTHVSLGPFGPRHDLNSCLVLARGGIDHSDCLKLPASFISGSQQIYSINMFPLDES